LRDHTVITKTVVEPAEQHDIVLEVAVRAPHTTTTAAASTKSSAPAETSATAKCRGPVPTAGEPISPRLTSKVSWICRLHDPIL
jgi:hypothetical protein